MQVPAVRISILIALFASTSVCLAQQEQQPLPSPLAPSQPLPLPQQATLPATPSASIPVPVDPTSSTAAVINGFYDKKPVDGTAAAKTGEVGERLKDKLTAADALQLGPLGDEEVKSRFEKFLGVSPVPDKQLADYAATVSKIEELLHNRKTFDAWKELFVLSQYQSIDAGVGRELANRIEAVWNAGQTNAQIQQRNQQLQQDIRTSSRNADMMSDSVRQKDRENARLMREYQNNPRDKRQQTYGGVPQISPPVDGPQTPPDPSTLMGKMALTDEYLRSLEARARIKVNELSAEKLLGQVKREFSDYVSSLYTDGFYTHVVIAADFYRRLFQDGDYPVEMAKQVNSALEKSRDVAAAVDVFQYKTARLEYASATDRLVEAFIASAYHPALLRLPRDDKQKVANYVAQLDSMRNLVEARDYTGLEDLTTQIKITVKDFDTTKPMALVNAAKLEAQLRLGKAKLLAQQGKMDDSMKEFEAAAQAWPNNPDLKDKAGLFFNTQDVKSQSLAEFDRLIAEKNYRGIFEKQVAFAPAIQGDTKREDDFKKALMTIKDAEIASEKANALLLNGDVIGAWESVELAAKNFPDDQKLNKLRADLSTKSAEFVSSISHAEDAEAKHQLGFALSCYVNAQRQYPPSQMANGGIARVTDELLKSKAISQ